VGAVYKEVPQLRGPKVCHD